MMSPGGAPQEDSSADEPGRPDRREACTSRSMLYRPIHHAVERGEATIEAKLGATLGLLVLSLVAGGCGDEKDDESARKPCGPAPQAMAGLPNLPRGFPNPAEVTYTASKKAGPSTIVSGYWGNGDLTAARRAYAGGLDYAGYDVTREEHDVADSEIAFAGGGATGQVKLARRCSSRVGFTVTIRPA